jgi:hypothetical protein
MPKKLPKVFCLGLSRTGTTALSHALENVGIQTLHYSLETYVQLDKWNKQLAFEPLLNLSTYKRWRLSKEIKAKKVKSIGAILNNFQAFSDLPFPLLYKELHEKNPDAKFIYTYRDEQKWLKSMHWLYNDAAVIWQHGWLDNEIMQWAYGTHVYDEVKLLKAYRDHHEKVFKYFEGNSNFLCLNLDKGELHYKNITTFLGLPVVDKPVERINAPQIPTDLERASYWDNKNNDLKGILSLVLKKFN